MMEIQKNTNATNLEGAEVSLALAKLDLKQYEEGTYPQQLTNAQTEVEMDRDHAEQPPGGPGSDQEAFT